MYDPKRYSDFAYVYRNHNRYIVYPAFVNPEKSIPSSPRSSKQSKDEDNLTTNQNIYQLPESSEIPTRVLHEDFSSDSTEVYNVEAEKEWPIFFGDCGTVTEFLKRKNYKSPWCIVKFLDALLRGFGQVIMANNPLSGLLFLITLFLVAPTKASVGLFSGCVGLLWSFLVGRNCDEIMAGVTTYNPVLLGFFTHHAVPTILSEFDWFLFSILILGVLLCVYLNAALDGFLSKWRLPCLTLPFIFMMYLLTFAVFNSYNLVKSSNSTLQHPIPDNDSAFSGMKNNSGNLTRTFAKIEKLSSNYENQTTFLLEPSTTPKLNISEIFISSNNMPVMFPTNDTDALKTSIPVTTKTNFLNGTNFSTPTDSNLVKRSLSNVTNNSNLEVENIWTEASLYNILHGTLHSASALVGLGESTALACTVFLCVIIFSPIMCLSSFVGALLSTLTAIYIIHAPGYEVFDGTWSYNGFLVGAALGGFTFILTWRTVIATLFAVVFTTLVQNALNIALANTTILQYNLAFNVGVMTFLLMGIVMERKLPRPNDLSFPEKERYEYRLLKRQDRRYHKDGVTVKHISVVKMGSECALPETADKQSTI